MSLRQIKKLQRKARQEESDEETPQKITLSSNVPKYSFSLLCESSESSESSSEEESVHEEKAEEPGPEESKPSVHEEGSEDSEWEKLLSEARESNDKLDSTANTNFEHFLSSPANHFKTRDVLETTRSKYSKRAVFESASRYWLSPGITTREFMQLRLLAAKQMEVVVETDPESGREKFVLELTDFFREVDDICSSSVHSQDFELFRRLMETHPFHLGLLVRASCINTISSNHQEAFGHLHFAVKILQTALPHRFSLYRTNKSNMPNVWAPSGCGDNQLIYRLLLLYMISLERKGQWQTSLAVCKLLMAMDFPNDVAHALLHVDMYLLNTFGDKRSISTFVYNYYKLGGETLPPAFWYLPNFALTLPLQLYLQRNGNVPDPLEDLDRVRDMLLDLFCLVDEEEGLAFKPKLSLDEHLELIEVLGDLAPYLLLLRGLLQYPLFIVKMADRTQSSPEVRFCSAEEPFSMWREIENEEYDELDHQLVRCYTYKCGDLWSGNNSSFLAQTANLVVKLYSDEDDRQLLETFQWLFVTYRMDLELPKHLDNVSVTEFDLSNYSLPADLEFPL